MNEVPPHRLDVALIHYPVNNRGGEVIGSAVTNLDLHDIARAGRTYGVDACWIVTPYDDQQRLAEEIVRHWTEGYGGTVNPDRREALSRVRICPDLEGVLAAMTAKWGIRPRVLATCAQPRPRTENYSAVRTRLAGGEPLLLLFGTAWGLTADVVDGADGVLPPIMGRGGFNHLSVRSAVAIILDRLLGE
ncbi:MAG: RNA methyltransferase [Desulfobulbaceae bacterium]|jgi:hypothetical protein|nr:RNA methyltransferase [Desulfobulbaceae bacterium]